MKLRETAAAVSELDEALTYYRDIHPDVAESFIQDVVRAKFLIGHFPYAWKNQARGIKGFVMQHYPYTIVYQIRDDSIWIVAYAHHKRRPGYWNNRLRNPH